MAGNNFMIVGGWGMGWNSPFEAKTDISLSKGFDIPQDYDYNVGSFTSLRHGLEGAYLDLNISLPPVSPCLRWPCLL